MAKNNFFLNFLASALESVGESQLEELLQDLHDSDKEGYLAAIHGGRRLVAALQPHVAKSKSKIDDAIINAINEALQASSDANDVPLIAGEETK